MTPRSHNSNSARCAANPRISRFTQPSSIVLLTKEDHAPVLHSAFEEGGSRLLSPSPINPPIHQSTNPRSTSAFTLLELLTVIAIIGILAAIALPTLNAFKPNPLASASRQLLDDLAYARHRAIADHTTVFILFMPGTDNLESSILTGINPADQDRLVKAQYTGYALYEKRDIGSQPGGGRPHYLTGWRTLPVGTAIAKQKFGNGVTPVNQLVGTPGPPTLGYNYPTFYYGTNNTASFWFFTDPENRAYTNSHSRFPYIAFNYLGSLASLSDGAGPWEGWQPPYVSSGNNKAAGYDCVIPLTRANITPPVSSVTNPAWAPATYVETVPGAWNDPNMHNHIVIDGPTGRARVDRTEAK